MEENLPQGERKKISAELFKKVLLANSDEAFESHKEFHKDLREIPIYRLTAQEISDKTGGTAPGHSEKKYTAVFNIEIEGDIVIDELKENVEHPLFCIHSKISLIKLDGSRKTFGSLFFSKCEIGEFELRDVGIENVILDNKTNIKNVISKNCRFKTFEIDESTSDNLIFSNADIHSLSMQNGSNIRDIILNNESKINGLSITNNTYTGTIQIYNSTIQNCLINNGCKIIAIKTGFDSVIGYLSMAGSTVNDLNINKTRVDSIKAGNAQINKVKIANESIIEIISFKECEKIDAFDFEHRSKIGNIYFSKCNTADLSFERGDVRYFYFYESFSKSLSIKNCVFGKIYIHGSSKSGDISIESSKTGFVLIEEQFCRLFLIGAEIPLLELKNCNIPIFEMRMANQVEAYVKDGHINLISFEKTNLGNNTTISFSGVTVYALIFDESIVSGALCFRSIIKAQKVFEWWHEVNPKYDITESSFQKQINDELANNYEDSCKELINKFSEPALRINKSSLGKTQFINFPFHEFDFQFNNSKINECFILGDKFPSKNTKVINDNGETISQDSIEAKGQLVSLNIQMKKLFENQGDIYTAGLFQAEWAESQKAYLKAKRKKENKSLSFIKKKVLPAKGQVNQDYIIFWINKFSNKHGESWGRAFWFTFLGSVFFYTGYLTASTRCFTNYELDLELIGYYVYFLNPVRTASFIPNLTPQWWVVIIDFLARLYIAFGIYQFIAAFRKHGRKK